MGRVGDRGGWTAVAGRVAAHGYPVLGPVLGALGLIESVARSVDAGVGAHYGLVLALLALGTTLPLALPRPAAAAIAITAASVLSLVPFNAMTNAGCLAQLIVLHRLGGSGRQLLAAGLALPFLVLALTGPGESLTWIMAVLLATLAPFAGWAGAARRARLQAEAQHAARQLIDGSLLEHAARGERARIARELHDVVAHHISMIAVQAESARLTTAGMPAAGARRLLAIGDTARTALTEMRRLLGVLREDTEIETVDRAPAPGLRQLNDLLDETRAASGSHTRLILSGPPNALDPGVELAAYRIVQEALTNVRRHAPGSAVDVELRYADDALRLRVRDNGPGPPVDPRTGGHGLLGMRERAAAVGGQLRTGPAVGGGFLLEAELPAKPELGE